MTEHEGLRDATAAMHGRGVTNGRPLMAADMPARERPLVEQFRVVAKQWVDADTAFHLLEDTKTSVFAQHVLPLVEAGAAVNRAELTVRASAAWHEHLRVISAARHDANLLKVHMEYIRMQERAADRSSWAGRTEHKMGRTAT